MYFIEFKENIEEINNFIKDFCKNIDILMENINYLIDNNLKDFNKKLSFLDLDFKIKEKLNLLNNPILEFYEKFLLLYNDLKPKLNVIFDIIKLKKELKNNHKKNNIKEEEFLKKNLKIYIDLKKKYEKNQEKIYIKENENLNFIKRIENINDFKIFKKEYKKLDDNHILKYYNYNNSYNTFKNQFLSYKNINLEYYDKIKNLDNQIFTLLIKDKNIYDIEFNINEAILYEPFQIYFLNKLIVNKKIYEIDKVNKIDKKIYIFLLNSIKKNRDLIDLDVGNLININITKDFIFKIKYWFFSLYLQDSYYNINSDNIEKIENILFDVIPIVFVSNQNNYKLVFMILYIISDIYLNPFNSKKIHFSDKFLFLLRKLNIFHQQDFWSNLYKEIIEFLISCNYLGYFNDWEKKIITNTYNLYLKYPFNSYKKVFKFILYWGNKVLNIEIFDFFNKLLNINLLNKNVKSIDINNIFSRYEDEYNNQYEKINKKIKKKIELKKNYNLFTNKYNKLKFIFIKSFSFINKITFFRLNKFLNFENYFIKKYLMNPDLKFEKRKLIYKYKYSKIKNNDDKIDLIHNDKKLEHIINIDLKRTKFSQDYNILKDILTVTSLEFPPLLYYQGMNCLGVFLVNFFKEENLVKEIFFLIIQNGIVQYLSNNFKNIHKLLYNFEISIKIYFPDIDYYFYKNNINVNLFITPWILTLFTCTENDKFITDIIDIYICYSWKGIIKIILLIIKITKDSIFKYKKESLMMYLNKELINEFLLKNINIKNGIKEFKISNYDLSIIEEKYHNFRKNFNKFWKDYFKKINKN